MWLVANLTVGTSSCVAGDDVSGWSIATVNLSPYEYALCQPFFEYGAGRVHTILPSLN